MPLPIHFGIDSFSWCYLIWDASVAHILVQCTKKIYPGANVDGVGKLVVADCG